METVHKADAKIENVQFPDMDSFKIWKEAEEVKTNSHYVQHCSSSLSGNTRKWYYYCNRAGTYKPRGEGSRQVKMQGSNKIGHQCTAHMKAKQTSTGEVTVKYCHYHIHGHSLGALPLPENLKQMVACKLKDGVAIDKIMDTVRDNVDGEFKREHLITRQDIMNIKRKYNIQGVEKHKDDQLSICAWVAELQSTDYNPVLSFKVQGSESDVAGIETSDFMLAIQTKFQCNMMKQFAPALVCLDATHGTNHYDFKLITVIVLDDHGEGIPCAWCISNKEDSAVLTAFFKALKSRTGPIAVKVVMSDDAEQYYSSWKSTYGGTPEKLLCSWHVDRAWRANIQAKIEKKPKGLEVYHQLRSLLHILDTSTFQKTLAQIITWMLGDPELERFAEYIQSYYCNRTEQWAYCYRIGTPANTNMAVESFHRLLKIVYLEGKHNRRIDHLLSTLLRIARDKIYEHAIKLEKGKCTYRIKEINKRHHTAVDMAKNLKPKKLDESSWEVPSVTTNCVYIVSRVQERCDCKLHCGFCEACIHKFSCSCVDSAIHSTVCKHCHLVQMDIVATNTHSTAPHISNSPSEDMHHLSQVLATEKASPSSPSETLKEEMKFWLDRAYAISNSTTSNEILKAGITHVKSAVAIMNALQNSDCTSTLTPMEKIAPNTNNVVQPRFTSVRKRTREQMMSSLTKPTVLESDICKAKIANIEPKVCAICYKENDKAESQTVEWIECTKCSTWIHCLCANINNLCHACAK
jgi:hypothetical protein